MTLLNWKMFLVLWVTVICWEFAKAENLPPMGEFTCPECDYALCPPVNCTVGILVKDYKTACGCCQRCIRYLEEGDSCGLFSVDAECGPGLTCAKADGAGRCTSLDTDCVRQQKDYDRRYQTGQVGMYEIRPDCDAYGNFKGKKCIPGSTCFCVDENDNRIFGEVSPSDSNNTRTMNCKCSRLYEKTKALGYDPVGFAHCLPNGNFDRLQCFIQACQCLDDKLKPMGNPFPITAIIDAPCYDPTVHVEGYKRSCEEELSKYQKLLSSNESKNITIMGLKLPNCTADGLYHPVQKNSTMAYCAAPDGSLIEDFAVTLGEPMETNMNCACARTRFLLENHSTSRPQCCPNGNYNPVQCRSGYCFCVTQWGEQKDLEVPVSQVSTLKCHHEEGHAPACIGN